jgi:tetratricopeptide (TPR) repeat protein
MDGTAAVLTLPPVTPAPAPRAPADARGRWVLALRQAEQLVDAAAYDEALDVLADVNVLSDEAPDLALRSLFTESWARMYVGEIDRAAALLEQARSLAESPYFSDADRAEAVYRLACCRSKVGRTSNAIGLFTAALELAERSGDPCDRLRAHILEWRSRCHQVEREWDAARNDADRAIELANGIGDDHSVAHALFQASLVAERTGETLLARCHAEQARDIYERVGDRGSLARILNNLGGLNFLLDEPEAAVACLKESFSIALEVGNDADAAQAVSSLAQVHLRLGAPQLAEEQARHAVSILAERGDYLDELGNVNLVLARALLEQDRVDESVAAAADAEAAFERLGSISHLAGAWVARGDAYKRRGETVAAADLYRRAALALQDFNF